MANRRNIFYSKECDLAAELLGGYERLDDSLDTVWDVLRNNPYKLPQVQSDWYNARYITTKPTASAPALIWLVTIDANGDVVIVHVEAADTY